MKRKVLPLLILMLLIFCSCQNIPAATKEADLWLAHAEDGKEIAQLVLDEQTAKIYFYSYEYDSQYEQNLLKQCFYIFYSLTAEEDGLLNGQLAASDYYYQSDSGEYLEMTDCQIQITEQSLSINYLDLPAETASFLPQTFEPVAEADREKAALNRPFYRDDVQFDFDTKISAEQFIDEYGQPLEQNSEQVWDEDYQLISLYYDWGSVQLLHYSPADSYSLIEFSTTQEKTAPHIRNIALGMDYKEVLQNFRLDYEVDNYTLTPNEDISASTVANIPGAGFYHVYGEEDQYYWRLYGTSLHWNSYGSIETANEIKYTNGLDMLFFEFDDGKLSKITYRQAFD